MLRRRLARDLHADCGGSRCGALRWGPTLSLAACQSDPNSLAAQAGSGSRAGYAAGDGSIEQLAPGLARARLWRISGT
jgi:hypothetical protein